MPLPSYLPLNFTTQGTEIEQMEKRSVEERESEGRGLPGVIPLRAQAGQRPTRLHYELVNHEQAVTAQLHQALAALQLLRRHHLAALAEDALP